MTKWPWLLLAGDWSALAATGDKPFAGNVNVAVPEPRWTDSFSHGELIRSGHDEQLARIIHEGEAWPRLWRLRDDAERT